MRRLLRASALLLPLLLVSIPARADDADDDVPTDLPRLVFDNGRRRVPAPAPDGFRFLLPGEHQLRLQAQRSFPMAASASRTASRPGLVEDSLGQNWFASHWLRVTPRLQIRDTVELVAQVDLLTGMLIGERAHDVSADQTPRDEYNGIHNIQPRWLFAHVRLPFGALRVGQQPNHWGMGILANDGDHPTLFGDYRFGSISERLMFVTKPGGKDSDFVLALAGDLVFRDPNARLTRGQQAFQGVLAAFFDRGPTRFGVFSTLRHQENDRTSGSPLFAYADTITAAAVDLHGRTAARLPADDTFAFAEAEVATIFGTTNVIRTPDQALDGTRTDIRSWGGAAVLGVVHRAWDGEVRGVDASSRRGADAEVVKKAAGSGARDRGVAFGDLVAQLEVGYASGDADPYDGTHKRFVFDPNHRIGLLLFDEVLRWQTARAASAAQDPLLANATRPSAGVDHIPSNGGIFGAQYVNPTFIVRPRHWLDLKGGMVLAHATSDVVDPYRLVTTGSYLNHRGGSPKARDLGVELDAGIEGRFPLEYGLLAQVGAQAGVLFPGSALANASGDRMGTQWIAVGRFGLLF